MFKRGRSRVLVGMVLSSAISLSAFGQSGIMEYQECTRGNPARHNINTRIFACSQVIGNMSQPSHIRAQAFYHRGTVYAARMTETDLAIADFTEAIRLEPNNAYAYMERGHQYKLAQALAGSDSAKGLLHLTAALSDFSIAIQINGRTPDFYWFRGNAYMDMEELQPTKGHFDRAIFDYNEALRLAPNNASYYVVRGGAFVGRDNSRALLDFSEAIRLNPQKHEAYVHRAGLYELLGRKDEAVADLRVYPGSY